MGRGARVRNPPDYYQADHSNIRYTYPNEADVINTCFQGAGYGAEDKLKTECCSAADHIDRLMTKNPSPVDFTEEQLDDHIMGVVMAEHFSLKKEINLFGNRDEEATTQELQAIHDMGTYEPLDASKLTRDEKRDTLESLLFITEKKDGRIKSRKCAIGSKQRSYDGYDKFAGISPTVTTK